MQNHDDDLEFDDDFLSDGLEDDVALEDFDDDFLGDEEWDDADLGQGEGGVETAPQAAVSDFSQKKKFSLNFNTILIGGAVILGVVVLSFQLMKGQKATVQDTRFISSLGVEGTAETLSEGEDVSANQNNSSENEEHGGGFLNDETNTLPGDLYMEEQEPIGLPMPTPVSQEVDSGESVADSLQFLTETHDRTPREPEVKAEPIVTPEVYVPQNEEVEIIVEESEVVNASVPDASLTSIHEKMDLFLDRMDGLENKINEIEGAQNQRSLALEKSVEALRDRVKSTNKSSTPSVSKTKKHVVKKSAPAPVSRKIQWQLKAAQPGKAWISQKGQNAIKAVRVGDSVDGVGKIQDIRLTSGRWIVVGSKGKIQQ